MLFKPRISLSAHGPVKALDRLMIANHAIPSVIDLATRIGVILIG